MADSFCCTADTNTTFQNEYSPIKIKKKKEKKKKNNLTSWKQRASVSRAARIVCICTLYVGCWSLCTGWYEGTRKPSLGTVWGRPELHHRSQWQVEEMVMNNRC